MVRYTVGYGLKYRPRSGPKLGYSRPRLRPVEEHLPSARPEAAPNPPGLDEAAGALTAGLVLLLFQVLLIGLLATLPLWQPSVRGPLG